MFVKRTRVSSGKRTYEYLSLVESYRDDAGRNRHRTIARLGEVTALAANGDLDRIIGALQRFAAIETSTDTTTATGTTTAIGTDPVAVAADEAPAWGGTAAVTAVWERLGLDTFFDGWAHRRRLSYDLGDAVLAMVINRLVAPGSKRRVIDWLETDQAMPEGFCVPELAHLYWSLDQLTNAKDDLEAHLWSQLANLANLDLSLACYEALLIWAGRGVFSGAPRRAAPLLGARWHRWHRAVLSTRRSTRSRRPELPGSVAR